jgi:hypothetical protein
MITEIMKNVRVIEISILKERKNQISLKFLCYFNLIVES